MEPAVTPRGRRRQLPAEATEGIGADARQGQAPAGPVEPVITPRGRRRLPAAANGGIAATRAAEPIEVDLGEDEEVRFAPEGHHPAETSTGLLSKLRRQSKLPGNHVHKFQESKSAVGLVRRVCVECSYVSIGSDD